MLRYVLYTGLHQQAVDYDLHCAIALSSSGTSSSKYRITPSMRAFTNPWSGKLLEVLRKFAFAPANNRSHDEDAILGTERQNCFRICWVVRRENAGGVEAAGIGLVWGAWAGGSGGGDIDSFSGGLAALVAALALGPRLGKYNRDGSTNAVLGHNHPLAAVGIFLILLMWIPYVVAFAPDNGEVAAFNAVLAASAGVVGAAIYCAIRYGRQDVFLVYAGMLGALVAISAGAGLVNPPIAAIIGAAAGVLIPYFAVKIDMVWKIDDPAGGIAIHGIGGILGAVAVALLLPGPTAQRIGRVEAAGVAIAAIGALTAGGAALVFFALRATVGIRVREADEFDGLDLAEYDLNAYPDFQQTTIKSYHLREM